MKKVVSGGNPMMSLVAYNGVLVVVMVLTVMVSLVVLVVVMVMVLIVNAGGLAGAQW